jgi:FkbM family methyltransferase
MTQEDDGERIEAIKRSLPASLYSVLEMSCRIKIVDVGANPVDGPAPYSALLATGRADVVGFEPWAKALDKLNQRKGPNETYLPQAVGDGQRHTLHHCLLPSMSSLLEPNPAVLSLFYGFAEWGKVARKEDVQTVRLDDVPETAAMDLLKIDIQGAELMVLKNAINRLSGGVAIHTEVEFIPMYKGQPLFSDVEQFLRSIGYVLHRFTPLATRDFYPLLLGEDPWSGHSQALWADAVFVRDFTRLDLLSADQLLRLAVILYDCYRSFDLVFVLLREHDRRTGLGYGKRFRHLVRDLHNADGIGTTS